MTRITVHLPFPISTNNIWRSNRGRVHLNPVYVAWIKQAGLEWLFQKHKQPLSITGVFSATLVLLRQTKKQDLDNHVKCVLDFCKTHGIIKNDNRCKALYVRWGSAKEAPMGARLILKG